MDLNDIHYVPLAGGKNNSGRQRVLGFSVWRRRDHKFLDGRTGVWGDQVTVNPFRELGRNPKGEADARTKGLRGVYVPESPVNLGPEPLDGSYTVLVNDREQDQLVVAEYPLNYLAPPAVPAAEHERALLAGSAVLVGLLLLTGLIRR